MAVQKLQVFLASRFEEFRDERVALARRLNGVRTLAVEAIDLNDKTSDERPALEHCYQKVDSAEVFVLLLGDTYGTGVHRHDGESYTHLEYRRAIEDRNKIILPWVRGSLDAIAARPDCDRRLSGWLLEIKKKHRAGEIDPALTAEQNAGTIFEVVLGRLWEVYYGIAKPPDDDDDDSVVAWDDSPIRRDELRDYVQKAVDRNEPPLRLLAANHAKEAWDALQLQLPQIAITHLRAAAELVPLDVVLSYWAARLLIATDRRPECVQGRTFAMNCARVAARQRDHVRQMVALILAARANERLEQRESAVEAAEAAHEVMQHHWLAKLELGRQYALSGDSRKALAYADEAFWLRAETIRQLDRDPPWRALGAPFDSFRDRLEKTVRSDTDAVFGNELAVIAFARELGEEVKPNQIWAEWPEQETSSTLQRVRRARSAARHTLRLLQACAKRFVAEAQTFKSHGFVNLRPTTLHSIEKERDNERKNLDEAARRKDKAEEASARAMRRLQAVGGAGVLVALVLAIAASLQDDRDSRNGLLLLAVFALVGVIALVTKALWPAYADARDRAAAAANARAAAARNIASHDAAHADFDAAIAKMRGRLIRFANLVHAFEQHAAAHIPISPVGTMFVRDKKAGDIVRVKSDAEQARLESDLFAGDLQYLAGDAFPARTEYWFAQYMGPGGDPDVYSRRAAYFAASG